MLTGQNPLFPVFLKTSLLNLLVVGGGNVALEKLTALLEHSDCTEIKLVAEVVNPAVRNFCMDRGIPVVEKQFAEADLNGIHVAFIAVNSRETSALIRADCKSRNILVNVADTPELCDFYLGSVVTKGQLKIGISTNGKSPTIAKRVKDVLNETFPDEIDELLSNMQHIRNRLSGDFASKVKELNELTSQLNKNREIS